MVIDSMSYATYERYKDSGVDWLGEIPNDWDVCKLKFLLDEVNVRSKSGNEELLSLSKYQGIIPKNSLDERSDGASTLVGYKKVFKETLVINKMQATNGLLAISKIEGITSPDYSIYKTKNNEILDIDYLGFLLTLNLYLSEFKKRVTGVMEGFIRLYTDDLYEIHSIIPPITQQKKIVNFLNQKTAQIDQAIALKQQQIEKLNEYKQIVIQNAVTKGLNPNAPMKNSGVAWIGDIPEHWDVIRFRNAFRFNKGLNITKENLNDEQGILCLNYGEIHSKYGFEFIPNVHPLKFVDESYLKNNQKSLLNDGDFVFADTSEDIEGSGNFSYINGQDLVFAGYHTLIAKPKINFNSRFIAYVLDSSAFRNQVRLRVKGVKVFSITQAILKTTFIWLPTEQEQNEIVKYLDEKMQKFNNAKIAYQIQIDRLKEYKNILINQAVTGKIKI
jgi:type I restriction enzyme S subunit